MTSYALGRGSVTGQPSTSSGAVEENHRKALGQTVETVDTATEAEYPLEPWATLLSGPASGWDGRANQDRNDGCLWGKSQAVAILSQRGFHARNATPEGTAMVLTWPRYPRFSPAY